MAKSSKVRVRYMGKAHRRTVNEYAWHAANGYVQAVSDAALVERLVANGDFVVVEDGPVEPAHDESKEQGT